MDDLRSVIDAAVTENETPAPAPAPAPTPAPAASPAPIEGEVVSETIEPRGDAPAGAAPADKPKSIEEVANAPKPDESASPKEKTEEPRVTDPRIDRAPQSWKGDAKKVWAELPLAARQEVIRRERDTAKVMSEAAQARQQIEPIKEAFAPHMDRIGQMYQGNPIAAMSNLLNVERTLVSGTAQDKANLVAKMIDKFGIDIEMLDSLLSNQPIPQQNQQLSSLEQMLEQRLAPVQQFIQSQQQREQAQVRQIEDQVAHTVETMAADPAYPYFEDVRQDMADIIEMGARRGVAISMEDAYTRAVRMNDDTFQATTTRESTQQATQAALQAHQAAQKAKGAAISVSGAPMGTGHGIANPGDLRGTIAAAFGDSGGRL